MSHETTKLSARAADRIQKLKRESLEARQFICTERARYLTEAYREHISDPMILRRAKAFRNVLENEKLFLEDGQLLAGTHASKLRAAPIFPEYSVAWIADEIDTFEKRSGDRFYVGPETREELLEIARWWKGKTLEDRCRAVLPREVRDAYTMGLLSASGNMTSGDGHIMLDFEKMLRLGAQGVIDEAKSKLKDLDGTDPDSFKKRIFYEAVITAYEGVIIYGRRCGEMAGSLARAAADPVRKEELMRLGSVLARVPQYPARSFYEAVQSVWLAHLLSQKESNGHSMSFGRLDQYLYPFYRADLDSGAITRPAAAELLCCLWIKAFGVVKIRPWNHTRFSGGGPTYQNLTLGGVNASGEDAVNDLTYLCLDSVAITRLPQPNVSARYSPKNPDGYLRRCVEVIKLGFGMPALHSDALMVPSLMNRGVSREDAENYAIVGCIEPIVPGKFGYRSAGMSFTNFAKMLEITLNGGQDPRTGLKLTAEGEIPADYSSFEALYAAYRKVIGRTVRLRVTGEHCIDYSVEELVPEAFCSGLIDDCIGRGKTAKEGGSVYDMVTGPETGIVNAANSLEAMRSLVFGSGGIGFGELKETLKNNFAGPEGEKLRRKLLNRAAKFGNDIPSVDNLANRIYLDFMSEQERYTTTRAGRGPIGCLSYPCTATISANVPSGVVVGASAEGRFAGEPLSEGCSACHGTDVSGPTAVMNSVAKMPNNLITGGNLLNLKFSADTFQSEESVQKLSGLVKAFFAMGGWHVQFNVVSAKILTDAQKYPERHRDLVVRVAGYSALFNDLEINTQNDIINRTEHSL